MLGVLLRHRGLQTILLLSLYLIFSKYLPFCIIQILYSLSYMIKQILGWILPFTVCCFIAQSIVAFKKQALIFLGFLLVFEGLSNFLSVFFSYGAAHTCSCLFSTIFAFNSPIESIEPLWTLPFKKPLLWSADKGAMLGIFLGVLCYFLNNPKVYSWVERSKDQAQRILTGFFSPLSPVFVLGFFVKMHHEKTLSSVISNYFLLVVCILVLLLMYISLLLLFGNHGSVKKAYHDGLHLLPPGFLAFTSGCSLSTMPWTMAATAKNLRYPALASSVIPATTNIQQIGDCITNTFLCFLIYKATYGHAPSFYLWMHFTISFVIARYATAAVMGGAIFLMLPIYEKTLSFSPEMLATMLAFNVILDPLVTSSNVVANGALCKIFENFWIKMKNKAPI